MIYDITLRIKITAFTLHSLFHDFDVNRSLDIQWVKNESNLRSFFQLQSLRFHLIIITNFTFKTVNILEMTQNNKHTISQKKVTQLFHLLNDCLVRSKFIDIFMKILILLIRNENGQWKKSLEFEICSVQKSLWMKSFTNQKL